MVRKYNDQMIRLCNQFRRQLDHGFDDPNSIWIHHPPVHNCGLRGSQQLFLHYLHQTHLSLQAHSYPHCRLDQVDLRSLFPNKKLNYHQELHKYDRHQFLLQLLTDHLANYLDLPKQEQESYQDYWSQYLLVRDHSYPSILLNHFRELHRYGLDYWKQQQLVRQADGWVQVHQMNQSCYLQDFHNCCDPSMKLYHHQVMHNDYEFKRLQLWLIYRLQAGK